MRSSCGDFHACRVVQLSETGTQPHLARSPFEVQALEQVGAREGIPKNLSSQVFGEVRMIFWFEFLL